jgi:uncharacterized membrane protein (UPF0127 family)
MHTSRLLEWRRSTTIILIVGAVLVLVGLVISFMATTFKPTTQVRMGSGIFSLDIADTESERRQGLSGVTGLGPNGGLLMQFDTSEAHGIWMKDMNISLDIIWLDANKKIVYIVQNAPPERPVSTIYSPKDPALYVIELSAGSVKKSGIKIGDTAVFNIDV